ncbi:hypothetical protein D3C75_879850 [compost metagenome]
MLRLGNYALSDLLDVHRHGPADGSKVADILITGCNIPAQRSGILFYHTDHIVHGTQKLLGFGLLFNGQLNQIRIPLAYKVKSHNSQFYKAQGHKKIRIKAAVIRVINDDIRDVVHGAEAV